MPRHMVDDHEYHDPDWDYHEDRRMCRECGIFEVNKDGEWVEFSELIRRAGGLRYVPLS